MTRIFEAADHLLIHTGYADPTEHRHHAAQIIISLGGELCVTAAGQQLICHGALLPSDLPHRIDTHGAQTLVFLYDASSAAAAQMQELRAVSADDCAELAALYAAFAAAPGAASYRAVTAFLQQLLGLEQAAKHPADARIREAMAYIRSHLSEPLTRDEAAAAVHLSPSRFSHLFRQQAGMTFAAYLIYQRLMHAYTDLIGGSSITEAALNAGFAGSAHFADVNRRVFGISASRITADLSFSKIAEI